MAGSCSIHLGLYGKFTEAPVPLGLPVGQVRMRIVGAEYGTDLRGPTVCEVIAEPEIADVVARLGPDPLRKDADPASAWARIGKSRRSIGALLMDQSVIAGVGNVYRSELLFRHHINPYRSGTHMAQAEFSDMWTDLVELMKVGVRRGKIVVVRPEHDHGAPSYGPGRPAPTCIAGRGRPAGCAAPRCAPQNWRAATCSGAPTARCERAAPARARDNSRVELILVVVGAILVTAIAHRRGMEPALIIVVIGSAVSFLPGFEPPNWIRTFC